MASSMGSGGATPDSDTSATVGDLTVTGDLAVTGTLTVTGGIVGAVDVDDTPVNNDTAAAISSNWAFDHNAAATGVHGVGAGTVAKTSDIAATKLDDLTAPDDNTDLNASTAKHGLQAKFPNTAGGRYQKEDGTWAVPSAGSVKLDDAAAPDDNTDLNASTTKHGLMMKYPNTGAGKYLGEDGAWAVPSSSGATYPSMPVILAAIQDTYVAGSLSKIQLSQLTHLAYDRAKPTSGVDATLIITSGANLTSVVSACHTAGKLAGVVLKDNSCLDDIVDSAALVDTYAANVAAMVATYDLDFLLLDWEGGGDTQARVEVLLHHLDAACPAIPIMAAVGWYTYQETTATVDDHVDYLWIMSYDMAIPNGNPFHANYQDTIETMKFWEDGGYDAGKLLIGIPFYSKDSNSSLCTYATIVSDYNPAPDTDYIMDDEVSVGFASTPETVTGGVAWFGGVNHNRRLVDYGRYKGYGGVGIWDAAQDILNNHPSSLLRAIYEENIGPLDPVVEDTVYESVTVNDATKNSDNFTGAGGKLVAQTFTPAVSHTVNKVSLSLYRASGAGTVTVTIRTTAAGLPTATVLATGTVLIDNHPVAYRRVDFDLGAGAALTASTVYAIVMGVSSTADIYYQLDTAGTYAGGNQCYYDGSWHTGTAGWEVWFREGHLNPASPVETVGLILPPATRKYENKRYTVLGAVGTRDYSYVCLKSASNTFSWVALADGGA